MNKHNVERICAHCGKLFITKRIRQLTCSSECSEAKGKEYRKNYYKSKPKANILKNCVICGNVFETTHVRATLCSDACKRKYHLRKNKECYDRNKHKWGKSNKKSQDIKVSNADLIAEDARKAKELGMSYGMYKAMKLMEGECYK